MVRVNPVSEHEPLILKLRSKRGTMEIVVSDSVLEILSDATKKIVTDASIDDTQRFKALIEELYWTRELSISKITEKLNIKYRATLCDMMRKLGIPRRNRIAALRLASTKYFKREFDGDTIEKLKMWFLVHGDGSVRRHGQQVLVRLGTPDPYLALFFRELFGRYGHVGVVPYKDSNGRYIWFSWVLLLGSFKWVLKREVPAPIDKCNVYDALGVAIDAEGSISAWKRTRRTTAFGVFLWNEKAYVIKPLQESLARLGYNPRLGKVPKGSTTNYGTLNSDCYHFMIRNKVYIKRLLKRIKLLLHHKRLKACLIRHALSDPEKPVYWEDIETLYVEIDSLYEEMLAESKALAKALYLKRQKLKGLWESGHLSWKEYQEGCAKLSDEAWSALQELKTRYDEKFSNLEKRIEACFRARRPHASHQVLTHAKLSFPILH